MRGEWTTQQQGAMRGWAERLASHGWQFGRVAARLQGMLPLGIMMRNPNLIPLSHQHHNGLALCVLTERSLRQDSGSDNIRRLAEQAVARFELEIVNHFELEESLLFPAITAHLGPSPLVEQLLAEHRRLETLVEQLRTAPGREPLLAFTALLSEHIRREERELFEDVQNRLPEEVMASLGLEFKARAKVPDSARPDSGSEA